MRNDRCPVFRMVTVGRDCWVRIRPGVAGTTSPRRNTLLPSPAEDVRDTAYRNQRALYQPIDTQNNALLYLSTNDWRIFETVDSENCFL